MSKKGKIILIVSCSFILRLLFGLNYEFWFDDNIQVYLIGLKFFTTGQWPFWGPDVVATQSALPGALQGLLVGGAFYICQIPEAPHILLNILSLSALTFFAWYLTRRISGIPHEWIYLWVLTLPSVMHYSTIVQNPSYVLLAAIPFFIGVFEIYPFYQNKLFSPYLAFYFFGFALLWIYQLHLSWILLLPYTGLAFYFDFLGHRKLTISLKRALVLLTGIITCSVTLVPTLLKYKHLTGEAMGANMELNLLNIRSVFAIIQDFFNYSVYEFEQFLPNRSIEDHQLSGILKELIWIIPVIVFLFGIRLTQYYFLLRSFWINRGDGYWRKLFGMLALTIITVWFSFLFTEHRPNSHKYYLIMPVSVWYSLHVYNACYVASRRKWLFLLAPVAAVIVYAGLMFVYTKYNRSLYNNRELIVEAIRKHDHTLVGKRREQRVFIQTRENVWKERESSDSLTFYNDFEYHDKYNMPQNVLPNEAYSGKYSNKVDSVQPFSEGLTLSGKRISDKSFANINFKLKCEKESHGILIITYNEGKENIFWHGVHVKNIATIQQGWNNVSFLFSLPDTVRKRPAGQISFYFSQDKKSGEIIYLDDLSIKFY